MPQSIHSVSWLVDLRYLACRQSIGRRDRDHEQFRAVFIRCPKVSNIEWDSQGIEPAQPPPTTVSQGSLADQLSLCALRGLYILIVFTWPGRQAMDIVEQLKRVALSAFANALSVAPPPASFFAAGGLCRSS